MTITEFLLARITEDEAVVRAECKAKRALVNDLTRYNDRGQACYSLQGLRRLGYLASVYADHPDYQQEWAG